MIERFKLWARQMFIAVNQTCTTWLRGWWYVWLDGELPMADEPFCSFIARRAMDGHEWAMAVEKILDRLIGEGHCQECATRFLRGL